jgi:hypothetical protein
MAEYYTIKCRDYTPRFGHEGGMEWRGSTSRRKLSASLPGKLLSPARRRRCIDHIQVALTEDIIDLARQYGHYGYRRVTALLRDAGWHVNRKRVERIWSRARPEWSEAVQRLMFLGRLSRSSINELISPPKLNTLPSAVNSTARARIFRKENGRFAHVRAQSGVNRVGPWSDWSASTALGRFHCK